jgi:hypothetical protein
LIVHRPSVLAALSSSRPVDASQNDDAWQPDILDISRASQISVRKISKKQHVAAKLAQK